MDTSLVLGVLAIICALVSVYFAVGIVDALRSRRRGANPLLVRWMIFKYLAEYRRITSEETGHPGPLYWACMMVSILAAIFAIGAIFSLAR